MCGRLCVCRITGERWYQKIMGIVKRRVAAVIDGSVARGRARRVSFATLPSQSKCFFGTSALCHDNPPPCSQCAALQTAVHLRYIDTSRPTESSEINTFSQRGYRYVLLKAVAVSADPVFGLEPVHRIWLTVKFERVLYHRIHRQLRCSWAWSGGISPAMTRTLRLNL